MSKLLILICNYEYEETALSKYFWSPSWRPGKFIVTLEDNIYTENENDNLPSTHISILYT